MNYKTFSLFDTRVTYKVIVVLFIPLYLFLCLTKNSNLPRSISHFSWFLKVWRKTLGYLMDARIKYWLCTAVAYEETQSMSSRRYKMHRYSQEHTYKSYRIKTSVSCSKLARNGVHKIHIHSKRILCKNSSNPKNVQQRRKSQLIEKWSLKKRLLQVCLSKCIV